MSEQDPNFWQMVFDFLSTSPIWQGAMLAAVIAGLRILYYNEDSIKWAKVGLEAALCGALSLGVTSIVEMLDLPANALITVGGAIGFIGVTTLRDNLMIIVNRKMKEKEQQGENKDKK